MRNAEVDALLMFKQESMYWLTGYDTFGYVFFSMFNIRKIWKYYFANKSS